MAAEQNETVASEQQPPADQPAAVKTAPTPADDADKDKVDVKENGAAEEETETAAVPEPEPPKEMRAVVLTGFGGLKTVKILKRVEPTLGEGEVLIRTKACGLNFQDLMIRQGAIDSPPKCPFILGFECAGEIELLGEGVEGFQVGDRVVALPEFRAWSELVAVPAQYVYKLPAAMTYLDAAAITMNFTVAYIVLFEMANITEGKSLLVHSVGGGVGQAVVQLARTIPNITIFGIASKDKHEALQAAANVATVDHLLERGCDYATEVRKVLPDGVDIVLDSLCGDECNKSYNLLKPLGKYILYGTSNVVTGETKSFFSAARAWWRVDKVSPIKLFEDNKSVCGFNLRHLMYQQNGSDHVKLVVAKVFDLFTQGKIKPITDSTWALEDVADAMQRMHDRKNIGKIVLDPAMEPKPRPATPAKGKDKNKQKQSSEEKKDDAKNGDSGKEGDGKKDEEEDGAEKKDTADGSKKVEEKKQGADEVMVNGDGEAAAEDGKEKENNSS